jgi:DNA (cytosine-5)-methyltransferase 1
MAEVNFHPKAETRSQSFNQAIVGLCQDLAMPPVSEKHTYPKMLKTVRPGQSLGNVYGKGFNWIRIDGKRPCPSISKSTTYGGLHFLFLPDATRSISGREAARCSSYPDHFKIPGTFPQCLACIGNSVPPLFMRAIASRTRELIGKGPAIRTSSPPNDYLASLESAWTDHLKPRDADAPTVISLFAGGGGSSLGYSMAGYRELLAVEWDDNAVATFKLNFPDVPVHHGDITKLSVADCLRLANVAPGELDVLDGSPPCQGFSTAGKRKLDDPRNDLFKEFVRLLRGLRPRAFVMENVSGMVKGKMKLVFAECLRELKASGYVVKARLLNAMYFGVPQSRQRMIFVGVRQDLEIEPGHPKAITSPVTVREAWRNIDSSGEREELSSRMARWYGHTPRGKSLDIGNRLIGDSDSGFNKVRMSWDHASATVLSKKDSGTCDLYHPDIPATPTIDELKRIGSYPDAFMMAGCFARKWELIGNSVPPLFMRAIAAHVRLLLSGAQIAS